MMAHCEHRMSPFAGGKAHSAPFCLMFALCRRAEGLSWGFAARYAAHGCALDSTEELWHLKYADSSAGTRISPRGFGSDHGLEG